MGLLVTLNSCSRGHGDVWSPGIGLGWHRPRSPAPGVSQALKAVLVFSLAN